MSELPDLPPPPRRTRPLPEGGLDAVVAAGRTRRSRALAAGTTTVLAVVLAAVLVPPTGAVEALHAAFRPGPEPVTAPTDAPAAEPSAAAAPTVDPTGPAGPATDDPAPSVPPASSSSPAPPPPQSAPSGAEDPADAQDPADAASSPTPRPTAPARATPTATPVPPATPNPTGPAEPPAFREDTVEAAVGATTCTPGPEEARCSYETTSGTRVERGGQVTAAYGQCQGRGAPPTVFAFDGGQEKDVVVTDAAGTVVFRFSDTVRYVQGPHERRTRPGTCLQWTGRWGLVTTAGEPVPAGTYRVTTTVVVDRVHPEGDAGAGARDVRASSSVTVSVVG